MGYHIMPSAKKDLNEITDYIDVDNTAAASTWFEEVLAKFEMLAQFPLIGRERPEIRANFRSFPFNKYLILYRVRRKSVDIIRVIHGARNLKNLL